MPVQFISVSMPDTIKALFKALGMHADEIAKVEASGIVFEPLINAIKVNGDTVALGATIPDILKLKLTNEAAATLLGKLLVIISACKAKVDTTLIAPIPTAEPAPKVKKATLVPATEPHLGVEDVKLAMKKPVVPLREATKLYQRVKGTSSGSVYGVVAIRSGLCIAAKISPTNVSVRAEGEKLAQFAGALNKVGLSLKGEYSSGHFDTGGKCDAKRVLGAILLGCGIQFSTSIPDCSLLEMVQS